MSLHTSLKVGGPADLYAIPEDLDDLHKLLICLGEEDIPWLAIGKGYNLLVRDKGIRGAVISLERFDRIEIIPHPPSSIPLESRGTSTLEHLNLNQQIQTSPLPPCGGGLGWGGSCYEDARLLLHPPPNPLPSREGGYIKAEAGAENLTVVRFAQESGLGGIGFISGIPGTIGGAIKMNAGAYGQGILEQTETLTLLRNGEICNFGINELDYGYRHLDLQSGDIVLAAVFRVVDREAQITEEEIRKDTELRRSKHNVGFPSAGSFFKNPAGGAAWRLIDAAGMRGARVGGAQVSEVHSNFLVNTGGATADDFIELAEEVKNAVLSASGVTLTEEVRIVGEK